MEKSKFTLPFEKPIRELEEQLQKLTHVSQESNVDLSKEIRSIETKIEQTQRDIYSNLTAWQRIQLARHPQRPYSLDYINILFTDFQELHGDRRFRDDQALIGGTAFFNGQPVMILAQQKGRNTKENILRNFGCPNPEGYRKALRLMKMAEKFNLPIISFVDTSGAFPGIGSEERHVGEAIALNILEMSQLKVPSITFVIGEGGSGGALGVALTDKVYILENAYYSVISPEGCASILWKDRAFAPDAAEALKITATHLLELGIVDAIIPEPFGGAHTNLAATAKNVGQMIQSTLDELKATPIEKLLHQRYQKFRKMGVFHDPHADSNSNSTAAKNTSKKSATAHV